MPEMKDVGINLTGDMLGHLLPMHLLVRADGLIIGHGPTLGKLVGASRMITQIFADTRPKPDRSVLDVITDTAQQSGRLFLRMTNTPHLTLRGHAVFTRDGDILINLGFGIELIKAVADFDLTDGDFAPPELAMELLFLHEANRAVLDQLSEFNRQLEEARQAAEVQAQTDSLTGLGNRRRLDMVLTGAMRAVQPHVVPGDRGFALMHLDLDGFKQVNDLLGHDAGDRALCLVAEVLNQVTRSDDFVARVGGDEFVLVLPKLLSEEALQQLGQRIIAGIEAIRLTDDGSCRISASIGMTLSTFRPERNAAQILKDADQALYWSKEAGRGRSTIFEAEPTRMSV